MQPNTQLQWYMQAQWAWVATKRAAKAGHHGYATMCAAYYLSAMQQAGLNG